MWIPDSSFWIPDSNSKNLLDSGFSYMGRFCGQNRDQRSLIPEGVGNCGGIPISTGYVSLFLCGLCYVLVGSVCLLDLCDLTLVSSGRC